MIQFTTNNLTKFFCSKSNIDEVSRIKLKYTIEVVISDFSKLFIMFIIFASLGKENEFIYASLSLFVLRTFTGGLHFKTYWGCLVFSILFFSASIYSAASFYLNSFTIITSYSLLMLAIGLFAPVVHRSRPEPSKSKKIRFKIISIAYLMVHLLMCLITNKNPYIEIATWVFIYQGVQLLIGKGVSKYEIFQKVQQ